MKDLSKLLLKASFIGTFAEMMLVPLYTALTNRFGGSLLDAGIGYALFSIITGLFVMLVGRTKWFSNNVRSMVFWGFLVAGICDLAYLTASNKFEFFAVQMVMGLSVGMLNPAWDALFSDDAQEKETHGQRWSFWTGGISFVTGTSALLGAVIVTYLSFTWLFVIMAVCDSLAVYYSYKVWRSHEANG